jgi:uncharacterized protein YndB with AHSA1/START domain
MQFFIIAICLLAIVLSGVLFLAASRPDRFRVQRRARINAPPQRIFPMINDFDAWQEWSPWERLDPALKRTRTGSSSGVGSVYAWEGNKKVGTGRMEIVESVPPRHVIIKLDFLKPFEAHNIAEFTLHPEGDATDVVWLMHGPSPFMARLFGVFMDMDKLIGKDFEKGLANMKAEAER